MEHVLGHSRKNTNRKKGKNGKRPLEFLDLSLYPWKFQTKWSFTPGSSTKLCYIHWNFRSKTNKQDPWKYHIIFSGSPFEIPLLFYWHLEFPHSILSITLELPCPQSLPVWMFTGIDHWKSGGKIYIYIYTHGLNSISEWHAINRREYRKACNFI